MDTGFITEERGQSTETVLFNGTEKSSERTLQSGQTLDSLNGPHRQRTAFKTDLSF